MEKNGDHPFYYKNMIQAPLNRSRNDKFIMVLDLPKALKSKYSSTIGSNFDINPIQFSIYGAPISPISVPAIDVAFGGQVYKASSMTRQAYDPLNVKFLVDNGYKNYWTLWNWINLFNDVKKSSSNITTVPNGSHTNDVINKMSNPMSDYTSKFTIYGLDEFNNKIISFEYTNAFPTTLSEIGFSNQDASEMNSTVTFVFNQLHVNLIKDVNQITC
jgi:hypothetical protein